MKNADYLITELRLRMNLDRLAKVGLFQKMSFEHDGGSLEIQRELKLHRAVIDRALLDTFLDVPEIKEEAIAWFSITNNDFKRACERALLDPELVIRTYDAMKEILKGENGRFKKLGPRIKKGKRLFTGQGCGRGTGRKD